MLQPATTPRTRSPNLVCFPNDDDKSNGNSNSNDRFTANKGTNGGRDQNVTNKQEQTPPVPPATFIQFKMFARSSRVIASRIAAPAARRAFSSGGSSGGSGINLPGAVGALAAFAGVYAYVESTKDELMKKMDGVQVDLAGKTNSAFLFIKPHACKGASPEKVQALVEDKLAAAGIRITGKGQMLAETIDQNMHIDTHYGAIASKAVVLKPSELNVPDKGKAKFQEMFGESWDTVVKEGRVYNAKDGAEKLGVDGAGLDKKCGTLKRGVDLIKFGGGFYCGKVDGIYVMNGFYMQMRSAYTNPGEKINWYTVSWPTDSLSWEDFRGKVLGATNPSEAPAGSIRRSILDQYKSLGLTSKPNTGDNGVHASASPFEGMAERVNWLGASVEEDGFGKGLLAAGVSKEDIDKWSGDCQVSVDGETDSGKTMSVFDTLEDLDADVSLAKVSKIH